MKVMQINDDRVLACVERPEPVLGVEQVRVAVSFCGICGSDLHMRSDPGIPPGAVLGHELSGIVSGVGADVDEWVPGDRVAVLPYESCGICRYCVAGAENFCVTGGHLGSVLGVQRDGGLAESVVAHRSALLRLPDAATLEQGALVEPVAVAVRAASRVDSAASEPVVVLGAGPIGLLVGLVLRTRGHTSLQIVDRNAGRLETARALGLSTLQPGSELVGLDAATFVDCTGAPAVVRSAVAGVRPRGRVVLVGLPPGDLAYAAPDAILREIEVVGSAGYSRADFSDALELLAAGELPSDDLITAIAPLSEVNAMFDELSDPSTTHIKILLRV